MSTEIVNRLSESNYFFETSLEQRLKKLYPDGNYTEYFKSLKEAEEKEVFAQYVSELKAIEAKTAKVVNERFRVPFDHDGYRDYLNRLRENAREYNKTNPILHVPQGNELLKPIPEEERRRRHALRDKWGEKVMEEAIRLRAQVDATGIMMRGKVSREVQIFMVGGTYEEMQERGRILCYGTPEEKRALFTSRMTEVLDFMDSMQTYKSDEDFLKATSGKRWILACLSELDKTGVRMTGGFGFDEEHPLDPALQERWEKWKNLGVSLGNLANRIDKLVSPCYELMDPENLTDEWKDFLDEVSDPDVAEEVGYVESPVTVNRLTFRQLMEKEGKLINPLSSFQHSVGLEMTEDFCRASLKDCVRYQLATKLAFPDEGTRYYTKDGRPIATENAMIEELYRGNTVTAVNGMCAADFSVPGKKGSQILPPSPMTYNRFMTADDLARAVETAPVRDPRLLNALALRAEDYSRHGAIWRLFHGGEETALNGMKAALKQNGFSETEILLAEKGTRLSAAELTGSLVSLVAAARTETDPAKAERIRQDITRLCDLGEQEKYKDAEGLEEAVRDAVTLFEVPEEDHVVYGEPIEQLKEDLEEKIIYTMPEKEPVPEMQRVEEKEPVQPEPTGKP